MGLVEEVKQGRIVISVREGLALRLTTGVCALTTVAVSERLRAGHREELSDAVMQVLSLGLKEAVAQGVTTVRVLVREIVIETVRVLVGEIVLETVVVTQRERVRDTDAVPLDSLTVRVLVREIVIETVRVLVGETVLETDVVTQRERVRDTDAVPLEV